MYKIYIRRMHHIVNTTMYPKLIRQNALSVSQWAALTKELPTLEELLKLVKIVKR